MSKVKIILLFLFLSLLKGIPLAQEINIVPYLKQIEAGKKDAVLEKLPELKSDHPNDPSLLFLEGVLTEDGQNAVAIYKHIIDKYPQSRYADASVYRIYSYYYALGLYQTAKTYFNILKTKYPSSPYVSIAEKKIPMKDDAGNENTVTKENLPVSQGQNISKESNKNLDYKFTIQAGAFSNAANAESLKKKFEEAGFFSEIKEKNVAGTIFHVVFVGKFLSDDEAKNFLDVINKRFNLNGRVVTIN